MTPVKINPIHFQLNKFDFLIDISNSIVGTYKICSFCHFSQVWSYVSNFFKEGAKVKM